MKMTTLLRRVAFVLAPLLFAASAHAQGGPPVVTDDPETPGNGKWEINVAGTGFHARHHWEVALPDADINYGLGDHIQLKADIPWVFVRDDDTGRKNALGAGNFGVKWRFIDKEDAGFSMSTYPQYTRSLLKSSERRGITTDEREFFLPIEASTEVAGWGVDGEVGRNFVHNGVNSWAAGVVVAHECGGEVECLGEVHHTFGGGQRITLLNLGLRSKINDSLSFLGAVGREFGHPVEERRNFVFYVGLQILK